LPSPTISFWGDVFTLRGETHRDATDLADLLRMGRLPEAWIAPPATRELRELVRHRAKLVGLRAHCKAEVHAVLAKCGVQVLMSDLFGIAGNDLLDRLRDQNRLPAPYAARISSLRRLIDGLEFEIDVFTNLTQGRLVRDPGYVACQQIPGIGPVLAAVFVAEIGDITRFSTAPQLACWAGLTPKHHESDTHVHPDVDRPDHQARVPAGPVGGGGVGADPAQDQPGRRHPGPGRAAPRPQHRRGRRRPPTARVRLLRAA
jgi:transposase